MWANNECNTEDLRLRFKKDVQRIVSSQLMIVIVSPCPNFGPCSFDLSDDVLDGELDRRLRDLCGRVLHRPLGVDGGEGAQKPSHGGVKLPRTRSLQTLARPNTDEIIFRSGVMISLREGKTQN